VNLRECLDNTGGSSVAAFALLDFLTKTRPSAPQPPAQ
jgi:hypothetical protein